MDEPAPARRRWRPRITIRLLMLLVLLCGIAGGYAYSVRAQREAVRAILKSGGRVVYDWEWVPDETWTPNFEWKPHPELTGLRKWIADRFGPDSVGAVAAVILQGISATDEHMNLVGRLKSLRELQLLGTSITDEGMAPIEWLKQLQIYYVMDTHRHSPGGPSLRFLHHHRQLKNVALISVPVSDQDLAHLANATSLEFLTIFDFPTKTPITDEGLAHLSALTRMNRLMLGETIVTSKGLTLLRDMANLKALMVTSPCIDDLTPISHFAGLKILDASRFNIGDNDLAPIVDMTGLTVLALNNTRVTDDGLGSLRGLVNLERISVAHTAITDAGVKHLVTFSRLKYLTITDSKITTAGIEEFQKAHPFVPIRN